MAPIQRLDISPLALAPHWLLSEWWVSRGVVESSEMHQNLSFSQGPLRQNLVTGLACAFLQQPAEMPISGGYASGDAS